MFFFLFGKDGDMVNATATKEKTNAKSADFTFLVVRSAPNVRMQFPDLTGLNYSIAVTQISHSSLDSKFSECSHDVDADTQIEVSLSDRTLVGKCADYFKNVYANKFF